MMLRVLICICLLSSMITIVTSLRTGIRTKRAGETVGDALGDRGLTPKKKKPPGKIIPPVTLGPGETAEQPPGWKHCIKNIRATLSWKNIQSPGYPDFLESQIQCSWIIEAPIGMKVKVAFRDLDMVGATGSCAKQFVQIIDIKTGKSQGRFCGDTRPGDYVTLGTRARLDLQADKAVTKVRGFYIAFSAVREISGFRTTKIFPPSFTGSAGGGPPGKVNVKTFTSNNKQNLPKSPPGSKQASKRLVYESDRNPESTDPSVTTTEAGPSNTLGTADDYGWLGEDSDINTSGSRRPSSGPLKVIPGSRPRTSTRRNIQPIIITSSRKPVRIAPKAPVTSKVPDVIEDDTETEQNIFGGEYQPYDPSHYTTKFPVRANKVDDHRPETLSTTSLIAIIASGAVLLIVVLLVVVFFCYFRRRRAKKKKKKKQREQKNRQEESRKGKEPGLELKVMNLGEEPDEMKLHELAGTRMDRQLSLPVSRSHGDDLPPMYQRHRDFPPSQDGDMERRDSMHVDRRGREITPPRLRHQMWENHRSLPRRDVPSHIQLRDGELRHNDHRSFHPGVQRGDPAGLNTALRHHSYDPRRHEDRYPGNARPPSPIRHQTLDPRRLQTNINYHGRGQPRYPSGNLPRGKSRNAPNYRGREGPLPPVPHDIRKGELPKNKVEDDFGSDDSGVSGSGQAPMRREYSPWEVEQQKRERKKKLINGEI